MIPKIIHYCWFGGKPLPELAEKCIQSWKKYCPDYEIKRWDEQSFNFKSSIFTAEAYEAKKWAFITDYVRLYVLYNYGGIYMDTDVEVCKSLDEFLDCHAFTGFENEDNAVTGTMASESGNNMIGKLLHYYDERHFVKPDGSFDTVPNTIIITEIVKNEGLRLDNTLQTVGEMTFYPSDYFCPKDPRDGVLHITENTACIHHFDGSWLSDQDKRFYDVSRYCERTFGRLAPVLFKVYKYGLHPKVFFDRLKKGP